MKASNPLISPRRRRLRLTIAMLALVAAFSAVFSAAIYFLNRPKQYAPGEANQDVTSELMRNLPADTPQPHFADVTRAAGLGDFRNFAGARTSQIPEDMGPGLAWGDFDGDGDDDLFLVSAGRAIHLPEKDAPPCVLYRNVGGGRFEVVADFPETRVQGMAAAWGDCDADGWLDLVITGYDCLLLFRNQGGSGRFLLDASFPNPRGFWAGASWGDFDNDRDLDLYVCGYVQYKLEEADRSRSSSQLGTYVRHTLNPASYEPGLNLLLRNDGRGTFTNAAPELEVTNPSGRSLGALWHDFDGDGWLDLYVANDISDNVFYHNEGGRFTDISHPALVADYRSAMGLAAGDWNRDGDDDIFVSHWVAQENALYDNLWADFNLSGSDRAPTGSAPKKYPLRFMDIADGKGLGQIALPYVGWGAEFADFDADGWLDLIVANGSTLEVPADRKRLQAQEPFLFWNRRGEHFYNIAPLSPPLSERHVSRGLGCADYDRDGDIDFAVAQLGEGVQLFRNDMRQGHGLRIRLRSRSQAGQDTGSGEGSTVIVRAGSALLRRSVSGPSYLSQSTPVLHFGLGSATTADVVEVRWHAGTTNYFHNLAADVEWEIRESAPEPARRTQNLSAASTSALGDPGGVPDKNRIVQFWQKQRSAMQALKVEKDIPKATRLLKEALALDPSHEDSRYYLSHCLAAEGRGPEALDQLQELIRISPQSHRAHQQWGVLRALWADSEAHLQEARQSLERAHALNPEETGALLVLGEVDLLLRDHTAAEEHLSAACRTNPKAVGGFFLRGYIAWLANDSAAARQLLEEARRALGSDWQPKGATSEGDAHAKWQVEKTPLSRYWEEWNGEPDPGGAFASLAARLR